MKTFCFTVDDNIRFFKELVEGGCKSLFDHPYLAMYRRLHQVFGLKVQLNLFYRWEEYDLTAMTDAYCQEWAENAHWLKMSFHSQRENERPYEFSGYREVFDHCKAVQDEILRFAGPASLGQTTTVHYCRNTPEGVSALADNGVKGLLGLFGTDASPRTSYSLEEALAARIRHGEIVEKEGMAFAPIDMVINMVPMASLETQLQPLTDRPHVWVMIHEQYFYPDYPLYQPDFEEKLRTVFSFLTERGYQSSFFEELIAK